MKPLVKFESNLASSLKKIEPHCTHRVMDSRQEILGTVGIVSIKIVCSWAKNILWAARSVNRNHMLGKIKEGNIGTILGCYSCWVCTV